MSEPVLDDLHTEALTEAGGGRDLWFGCREPERPDDLKTLWVWECDRCMIHMTAAATLGTDLPAFNSDGGTVEPMSTMRACFAEAMAWRGEHGFAVWDLPTPSSDRRPQGEL